MTESTSVVTSTNIDRASAEPFRAGSIQWLRRPGEGDRDVLGAGYWFISPDQVPPAIEIDLHTDETIYIIEGRIQIEVDGIVHDLVQGSSLSINAGTKSRWTVLEPTVEFFVYS